MRGALVVHFDLKKKHYLVTLALVSPRRNRRLRAQTSIFTIENHFFWSKWLKLGLAWPKPGVGQILEIWEPGNPEIWDPKNQKDGEFSKSKSVLPKMSARSGLAGKRPSRPHLVPSQAIFPWTGKIEKMYIFCQFSLVGQWALFTRFGNCCPFAIG